MKSTKRVISFLCLITQKIFWMKVLERNWPQIPEDGHFRPWSQQRPAEWKEQNRAYDPQWQRHLVEEHRWFPSRHCLRDARYWDVNFEYCVDNKDPSPHRVCLGLSVVASSVCPYVRLHESNCWRGFFAVRKWQYHLNCQRRCSLCRQERFLLPRSPSACRHQEQSHAESLIKKQKAARPLKPLTRRLDERPSWMFRSLRKQPLFENSITPYDTHKIINPVYDNKCRKLTNYEIT